MGTQLLNLLEIYIRPHPHHIKSEPALRYLYKTPLPHFTQDIHNYTYILSISYNKSCTSLT